MSNSFESGGSGVLETSIWTMSTDGEQSGDYIELIKRAGQVYGSHIPQLEVLYSGQYIDHEDDVNSWTDTGRQLFPESEVFRNSDTRERYEMVSAWWGDIDWIYGEVQEVKPLGEPVNDLESRIKADKMSRFVLSGLLGDFLTEDDELRMIASRYDLPPLDTAILVGGAALATRSRPGVGATYLGKVAKNYIPETWTGGDVPHRDFRSSRHLRPVKAVTTSLRPDRVHDFMPVVRMDWVAGGHSTELNIIEALLVHSVEQGINPAELHDRIVQSVKVEKNPGSGPCSDYSPDDGSRNEYSVRYQLERLKKEPGSLSGDAVIEGPPKLLVVREKNSVRLVGSWLREDPEAGIVLPDDEIPDYIAALISGGGGRTSASAMLWVVDALIEEGVEVST